MKFSKNSVSYNTEFIKMEGRSNSDLLRLYLVSLDFACLTVDDIIGTLCPSQ